MQNNPNDSTNTMTVDIRLCGNIPRNEMKERFGAPCVLTALTSQAQSLNASCLAETNGSPTLRKTGICDSVLTIPKVDNMKRGVLIEKQLPLSPLLEPPSWAVPARGETRLEPVCESLGRQIAVDLTQKNAFRIGRSPSCDIQLMHATSSRRHAMIFHHDNGSCYLVDCGSAHGTYVNGKRIASPAANGVVVPHKVRRGSLIRFGGQGAPSFVLKSFSFQLNEVETETTDDVRRNTRLNALGKTASETIRGSVVSTTISRALSVARKRSFDSLSSRDTLDEPFYKRPRCSSPPSSPEFPMRLVSPDLPFQRRVTFCPNPQTFFPASITPEESSDEGDEL